MHDKFAITDANSSDVNYSLRIRLGVGLPFTPKFEMSDSDWHVVELDNHDLLRV